MPHNNFDELKKEIRKHEVNAIASDRILDDIEELNHVLDKSISSDQDHLTPLINSNIPFINSEQFLTDKNFDLTKISVDDFLSIQEIKKIEAFLNRPLIQRAKWDRWDYLTVFTISLVGVVIDTLVGNPKRGVSAICSDKNSFIGSWFEKIHSLHSTNNPMDYQGYKMGGGGHRLRSVGHDLLGFPFGIWQIMNGTFTGGFYQGGKYFEIFSKVNQYGNPYESQAFIEALFTYIGHVFCDFFSTYSLPVPGFGYLAKLPSREIRKFAAEMYENGYNLRHMLIQGFSVFFIEIMVRTYSYFRLKKILGLTNEQYTQKRRELLLLSHSIVAGFNVGKVAITGNVLSLNLPQIIAVVFHFLPYVMFYSRNNNKTQKILRNFNDLKEEQQNCDNEIIENMEESKTFKYLLNTKPIILNLNG